MAPEMLLLQHSLQNMSPEMEFWGATIPWNI
jgi:hypothetical protein